MKDDIKEKIVQVAKWMYDKQMVNALEGNISVKDGGRIYVTPSAVCKGFLTREMICVVDEDGKVLEGSYVPTSELKLHLACYRLRKDITSVIHNHSPFATAHAIANKPIESKAYPEMILAFDTIPVVKYGTPSTDEVHAGLETCIFETDVFLISRHGIVSVGTDVYDAFFKIEAVESITKVLTITKLLGGEAELPKEKLDVLYRIREEKCLKQ